VDRLIAFVASARPDDARAFYRDVLGLTFVEESPFAIVFLSGQTMLRIQKVAEVPEPNDTALGWEVDDIAARMAELAGKGVAFARFDGIGQDKSGIWHAPDGTKVAWFRDPDGNLLSLTQFAR
jgi:catechol 2,3-dioxygenase-like lactoylglutathione lyase family enzyme